MMGCYLHIVDGFALKIWFLSRRTAFCHQSWVRLTTITADQCKAIFQYTVSIMIILAVNYYYGHHRFLSIDVIYGYKDNRVSIMHANAKKTETFWWCWMVIFRFPLLWETDVSKTELKVRTKILKIANRHPHIDLRATGERRFYA